VLVFGLTTGCVVEGGVRSGLEGSAAELVLEPPPPPPQALTNRAKVRLKKTVRQAPSDAGFAFRFVKRLEVDMAVCFSLDCEYFIVGL
jgi:hypothetical protein